MKCDICGREEAEWICVMCDNKMVCTDCDLKWHRHPKRLNHTREPLKSQPLKFASITSSLTSPGNFVRTKSMSERVENSSAPGNADLQKEFEQQEYVASVAGVDTLQLKSDPNEALISEEYSTSQQTGMNFLPKCVAEINEDLSYQSLFGAADSCILEHNSTGQREHNYTSDTVRRSNSRQFNSLTSDFQSTLQSLQSKMDEVNSTIGQNGSRDVDLSIDDWSPPQAVSKQHVASNGPAPPQTSNTTVKNVESRRPVLHDADETQRAIDDDPEVALLLAQTKYPPNMGVPGPAAAASTGHPVNEQVLAHMKPQNTGQSVLRDLTSGTKDTTLTKGSVRRPPDGYDLPRTDKQNILPVENGLSSHSAHKDVLSSQKTQSVTDRQKSQTRVKERLTDLPGVVLARVEGGEDLGVLQRPSGGSEPDYHSKFTDIHDEVFLLSFLLFFLSLLFFFFLLLLLLLLLLLGRIACTTYVHCESKKQGTTILSITSPNVDRFSNFFH